MKRFLIWFGGALALLLVIQVGITLFLALRDTLAPPDDLPEALSEPGQPTELVEILPANALSGVLNATGSIDLVETRPIVLKVGGDITSINVVVGQRVAAGDLLLTIDPTELARTVAKAEVELEIARLELAKQSGISDLAEVALAQANLLVAQENLTKVRAGPTAEERGSAKSNAVAAWAKYNDLVAPPNPEKITQAKANFLKAEIERQEAQRDYDKIAWLNEAGMMAEAARLQKATIEYERVKAEYEDASKPATQADIQSALSAAQKAQDELNRLQEKPTAAELAEAAAKVAEAEAKLTKLQSNAATADAQLLELKVKKALIDLEEAQANLQSTQITAPVAGVVLDLKVKAGERSAAGTVVATLGEPDKFKLTIDVSEIDINQIAVGQSAEITLDAVRGQTFSAVVEEIAQLGQPKRDIINYQVTLHLRDATLAGVRAGMTAIATFEQQTADLDTWLVPSTALQQQNGKTTVMVVRNGSTTPVTVQVGTVQGEWTNVKSSALQAGDQVLGSISSFVDKQAEEIITIGGN